MLLEQDIHLSPRSDNVITGQRIEEHSSGIEVTGIIEPTEDKPIYRRVINDPLRG